MNPVSAQVYSPLEGPQSILAYTSTTFSTLESLTRWSNSSDRLFRQRYKLPGSYMKIISLAHNSSGPQNRKAAYPPACASQHFPSTDYNSLVSLTSKGTPSPLPITPFYQLIPSLSQIYPQTIRVSARTNIKY